MSSKKKPETAPGHPTVTDAVYELQELAERNLQEPHKSQAKRKVAEIVSDLLEGLGYDGRDVRFL